MVAGTDGIRLGGVVDRGLVEERLAARTAPLPTPPDPSPPPSGHGPRPQETQTVTRSSGDGELVPFSAIRRRTGAHLRRSLDTAAHALVITEVDYGAVDRVRRTAGLTYLPFVARAVVEAIRAFPHVNATSTDDGLLVSKRVHLGVAVDLAHEGLVVPVVRDADGLRLGALARAVEDVAERARTGRLAVADIEGGTFTLTNIGSQGTVAAAPIINHPQVAILSTDGIRMRPVAVATDDGEWAVTVRPVGNLSLSFDHRAFDGAYAGAFLARVRQELEQRDWEAEA